ncbi:MAG: hypothetical protein M3135_00280 [Actinomycetota bacterium]|nr:hypothetical protein [Actinomycetota bacterium]
MTTPEAAAAGCFGKSATITGTAGKDRIRGTSRGDVIASLDGNDFVAGRRGNDLFCLGKGNDLGRGQDGKDRFNGGAGADGIGGDAGNDLLVGGGGGDGLYGGSGADRLKAGGGTFEILNGGPDNDLLLGGGGQDLMLGLSGNDRLNGGGTTLDVASFFFSPAGVNANLGTGVATGEGNDVLVGVEALEGSPANDTFVGTEGEDFFWDYLGDDVMDGAGGRDLVTFFNSQAPVTADLSTDSATGQGTDSIPNIEDLAGTELAGDSLTGDSAPNFIAGLSGDDSLTGAEGDDELDGFDGTDTGNGGPHVAGDLCVSIEVPTDCETFARVDDRRRAARTLLGFRSASWHR